MKPHVAILAIQAFVQPISVGLAFYSMPAAALTEAIGNGLSAAAAYLTSQGE